MSEQPQAEEEKTVYLSADGAAPITRNAVRVLKEVYREMTDPVKIDKGNRLAELELRCTTQKREKKAVQTRLLEGIRETEKEIAEIAEALDSGREIVEMEALVDFDQEHQEVRTYDPEGHKCVERRRMSAEEIANPTFA